MRGLEMQSIAARRKASLQSPVLSIASIPIHLKGREARLLDQLEKRYRNFLTTGPGTFEILLEPSEQESRAWEPVAVPKVSRRGQTWEFQLHQARAEFDGERQRAVLQGALSVFTFDSFLRIFLTLLLLERDGLVLHAATLRRSGSAHIFLGRSGAGKTTLSRLAPADQVLTDEISLLRLVQDEPRAYGSPFWGELAGHGADVELPLQAFYLLAKDRRTFIEPLRGADALTALCAHTLFFVPDRDSLQALLRVCARWVEAVPVSRLHFAPDETVWEVLANEGCGAPVVAAGPAAGA